MGERYTRLFSLPENLYSTGAPVIIAAGALLKDNQTGKVLAQLKLCSISCKTIKAATVSIKPLDTVGLSLGDSVTYLYLDLQAVRDTDFGQRKAIPLPNPATRSFGVIVTEAIFTDNSIWHGDGQPWEALAEPTDIDFLGDKELTKQFQMEYGGDCKNLLLEQKNLWHCVCGAINRKDETNCHLCRRNLSALQSIDMEELCRAKEARKEAEREQAKKVGKLAAIVVPALAIVIIAATIISSTAKKANAYKDALTLMDNEQYEEAITAFTALNGYKDSAEQIQIAEGELHKIKVYNDAMAFLEAREYQKAYDAFETLGDYKDAKDYLGRFQYKEDMLVSETKVKEDKKVYDKHYDYNGDQMVFETLVTTGTDYCVFYNFNVSNASTLTAEHDYDINGNVTETRVYQEDGHKIRTLTYKYDSNGYLVEKTDILGVKFNDTMYKDFRYKYKYDERGNMILETWYEIGKEGTYSTYYYEYDEQNQLIGENGTTYENQYDKKNRLIRHKSVSAPGTYSETHEYEYDDSDNVTMHRVVKTRNKEYWMYEYSYEYDAHGNKVKETYKYKDSPDSGLHNVSFTTYTYEQVLTFT